MCPQGVYGMNFRPVNAIFSTKLEVQIALTLLYLGSNFGEWYMENGTCSACARGMEIALGICVSILKHQLSLTSGSLLLLRNQFGITMVQ